MIKHLKDIFLFPALIIKHWELLWSFVHREIKSRIEGSILGRLWPVVQPLALFLVYYMIFAKLLKLQVPFDLLPWEDPPPGVGETIVDVSSSSESGWRSTFFLLTGILPWIMISESLMRCSGIVLENANLIKKIAFPSEFLPTYVVMLNTFYFLIGFAVFLLMELLVNGFLPLSLLWFPVILLLQMIFVLGLGMLVGALNIFIRDVSQIVPLFSMFWMFSSPVFYDPKILAMLGSKSSQRMFAEFIVPYLYLNPVYNLLTIYRDIFRGGRFTEIAFEENKGFVVQNVVTDSYVSYDCLLIFAAQALITFVVGYAFFLRSKGRFADEI